MKCIFYMKRITEFTYEMCLLRETYYWIYGTYFLSFSIFEDHKFNDKFRQTLITPQLFSQENSRGITYCAPFLGIDYLLAIIYLLPCIRFTLWFNNQDSRTSRRTFISGSCQISIWQINFISGRRDTRNSTINSREILLFYRDVKHVGNAKKRKSAKVERVKKRDMPCRRLILTRRSEMKKGQTKNVFRVVRIGLQLILLVIREKKLFV